MFFFYTFQNLYLVSTTNGGKKWNSRLSRLLWQPEITCDITNGKLRHRMCPGWLDSALDRHVWTCWCDGLLCCLSKTCSGYRVITDGRQTTAAQISRDARFGSVQRRGKYLRFFLIFLSFCQFPVLTSYNPVCELMFNHASLISSTSFELFDKSNSGSTDFSKYNLFIPVGILEKTKKKKYAHKKKQITFNDSVRSKM